jgi:hypothetical protein
MGSFSGVDYPPYVTFRSRMSTGICILPSFALLACYEVIFTFIFIRLQLNCFLTWIHPSVCGDEAVNTCKFRDLSFLKRSLYQKHDTRFTCMVEALQATANSATAKNEVLHSPRSELFFWTNTQKLFTGAPTHPPTPPTPLRLRQPNIQFCRKFRVLNHSICGPWYCSR